MSFKYKIAFDQASSGASDTRCHPWWCYSSLACDA